MSIQIVSDMELLERFLAGEQGDAQDAFETLVKLLQAKCQAADC
jgi:hypothetical protein